MPREYAVVGVPAVFHALAAPDLLLTWVELSEPEMMLYVTPARAAEWDSTQPGWRAIALAAMQRADAGRVFTHEKRAEDGSLVWVAMMHDDGLGSIRLLLTEELARVFPTGYLVALPDRSCGLAVARDARELDEVRTMVAAMQSGATIPMIPDLRDPAELRSPAG